MLPLLILFATTVLTAYVRISRLCAERILHGKTNGYTLSDCDVQATVFAHALRSRLTYTLHCRASERNFRLYLYGQMYLSKLFACHCTTSIEISVVCVCIFVHSQPSFLYHYAKGSTLSSGKVVAQSVQISISEAPLHST